MERKNENTTIHMLDDECKRYLIVLTLYAKHVPNVQCVLVFMLYCSCDCYYFYFYLFFVIVLLLVLCVYLML